MEQDLSRTGEAGGRSEADRWRHTDLYVDEAAWQAEKTALEAVLPSVGEAAGRLVVSAEGLADALDRITALRKTVLRLYVYANVRADEDTRAGEAQARFQQMQQLHARFRAACAYVEPELLAAAPGVLEQFLAGEPRLAPYAFFLRDLMRRAPHTLSEGEERLLAQAVPAAHAVSNVHGILTNADFPYPVITLSDGRTATVDQAGLAELRARPDRRDREAAMSAFFGAMGRFGRTFGTLMHGSVQRAIFYARARRYASTLEAALDGPHIPVDVYTRLVDGVRRHLPTFHRYLRLRRRMLGLEDDLRYWDLYAPLVADVDLRYTAGEAYAHITAAMAPLGPDYTGALRRALDERWIDWYPAPGKRAGAYSNGAAYDVHPYVLMNYQGHYADMSTLAHEMGHAMHSHLSNRTQPFQTAGYHTFVAEVASTFNEALLNDYLLRQIDDRATRLSLLGQYLERIKGTVVRQAQFAEFERRMHEEAERGTALTGDTLAALYLDITRAYYGHADGVCLVDEVIAHEWSYIPHFYRDFYVFQYATSFAAAEALSAPILAGDADATARYLTFLGSGGSQYPIDLLRDAGVDMTTDAPLDLTMARMNAVIDAMEALL